MTHADASHCKNASESGWRTDLVVVDVTVPGDDDALLDPRLRQAAFQRLQTQNRRGDGGRVTREKPQEACVFGAAAAASTLVMCVVVVVHRDSEVIV